MNQHQPVVDSALLPCLKVSAIKAGTDGRPLSTKTEVVDDTATAITAVGRSFGSLLARNFAGSETGLGGIS